MTPPDDKHYMQLAFREALQSEKEEEVPIGAVIVCNGRVIARAHNQTETLNDPTAHAEMLAITAATGNLGGKYLPECMLYVTLEPCVMCAGALNWAQIGGVVFGARDEKKGFLRYAPDALHPKTVLKQGVLEKECGKLMSDFFRKKR